MQNEEVHLLGLEQVIIYTTTMSGSGCLVPCELTGDVHSQGGRATAAYQSARQSTTSKIVMQEEQVPDRAGKFKPISRRAVTAGEGSSRLGVLSDLPPLSLVGMLHATAESFST